MEQALVGRNKRSVRELEGVVEDALNARKPTKVGLVAHHDGVVATLGHQGTDTLDTTGRTGSKLRHADSFLVVSIKTGRVSTERRNRMRSATDWKPAPQHDTKDDGCQ